MATINDQRPTTSTNDDSDSDKIAETSTSGQAAVTGSLRCQKRCRRMMPRASDAQDGDYVPPREIAHDLDKQYELRKRKLSENQYYEGPDEPDERRMNQKRVRIDESELPPRPTTPEIKPRHPPNWLSMNRKSKKEWEYGEKSRLAEGRIKEAIKYLHLFPNPQRAANHFRVHAEKLKKRLETEASHRKTNPSGAVGRVRSEQKTEGPGDKDLTAKSTQPAELPPLKFEDTKFVKPRGWSRMTWEDRQRYREEAKAKMKHSRLMKAVFYYQQGFYTILEKGAVHFQVGVRDLKSALDKYSIRQKSPVRPPERLQHGSKQDQKVEDRHATEAQPSATEDVYIKPDPELAEEPSQTVGSNGPLSEEDENDIIEEIRRRVKLVQQPSYSRIRDIVNARLIDRDGLDSCAIIDVDWVRAFIRRHEYLRKVYNYNPTDQPSKTSNDEAGRGETAEQKSVRESVAKHIHFDTAPSSPSENETVPQPDPDHQLAEPTTSSARTSPAATDQPTEGASDAQHNPENHAAITSVAEEDRSAVSPAASHAPLPATESHTSITAQGHSHHSDRYSPASTYLPDSTTEPNPRTDQYPSNQSTHPTQNEEVYNSISEMSEREPPPQYLTESDIEIRLRITYNDDTRIVALDPEIQISALMQKVAQKFGTTRPLRLQISDKDGMITIGDQEDLSFVLADTRKWGAREGREIVQLQVFVKEV